jgi:hypothetical protein
LFLQNDWNLQSCSSIFLIQDIFIMRLKIFFCCFLFLGLAVVNAAAQRASAPEPQTGVIIGTVIDVNNDTVPEATVVLKGSSSADNRTVTTDDNGFFRLDHLKPGTPYTITIGKSGFAYWTSPVVVLKPSQFFDLSSIRLEIAETVTTVTAALSNVELATEQEHIEEQQRVLGFIPNFYVVYDHNAVALTPKLKFRLAWKTETDAVTFVGVAFLSGLDHAADTPDFGQGAQGYGKRLGANYANSFTDTMLAGAVLPSLLHQDPRYFYQGTGTNKSRLLHALSNPFICRGDNGRLQPNYSALGGYLASGAIANAYYPVSNRGPGLMFSLAGVDIGADLASSILQEFVLRKLTPSAKKQQQP